MTSPARIAANRRNACRSTGPRSAEGKARAARNACRHGLTAAPEPGSVETWLRIVLGRPELSPREVLEAGEEMRRALALARAEARCARAREVLQAERANPVPPCTRDDLDAAMSRRGPEAAARMADLDARIEAGQAQEKNIHLLERYLREAEGARRKAFRAWTAWLASADAASRTPESTARPVSRNEAIGPAKTRNEAIGPAGTRNEAMAAARTRNEAGDGANSRNEAMSSGERARRAPGPNGIPGRGTRRAPPADLPPPAGPPPPRRSDENAR